MSDDRVSAELAATRALIAGRDKLVARMALAAVPVQEFNASQDRLAERVPRLLAAVEAVLKLHAGDISEDYPQETPLCGECGEWVLCTTTKAIERALTGEDPQ